MTIAVVLESPENKSKLQVYPSVVNPSKNQLATVSDSEFHGVFKAATRTTAGTTIIAEPKPNGTLLVTDLIMTTDKTANSDVTLRFTDGTNTINIIVADSANATVNLAIALNGRFLGWKDARIEMVTVQSVTATVTLGYVKIPIGLEFTEWDGLR